ncbi:MAG: glutathione S-transferase N-terminal domain-containing protein, partial [Moraxellaceae bacterium]|nr:glutathione S-transferase N-terminal domain-containing protein [Moraxellaceae bacterium]
MKHSLNIISSVLSSTLRGWRGSAGSKSIKQPPQMLILFDNENNPECRLVREALTELNLDVLIYPCPQGADRFAAQLQQYGGSNSSVPFLVDPNSHVKLEGAEAINAYLFQQYKQAPIPKHLDANKVNLFTSRLASIARLRGAIRVKASREPQQPLMLYSFESSPYSRPVRERLCELQLPYHLINLGKQQFADVGPANFRFHLGEYHPLPNTKRATLLAHKGQVQVPFLIDPNQSIELLE